MGGMTIVPQETPCLRCIFMESPPPGTTPTCDTAGFIASIAAIVANIQCAEGLKLLVGAKDRINRGMVWIDLWESSYEKLLGSERASDCPTCGQGNYEFLEAREGTRTAIMCGRGAIQISPRAAVISFPIWPLDFRVLARFSITSTCSASRWIATN